MPVNALTPHPAQSNLHQLQYSTAYATVRLLYECFDLKGRYLADGMHSAERHADDAVHHTHARTASSHHWLVMRSSSACL